MKNEKVELTREELAKIITCHTVMALKDVKPTALIHTEKICNHILEKSTDKEALDISLKHYNQLLEGAAKARKSAAEVGIDLDKLAESVGDGFEDGLQIHGSAEMPHEGEEDEPCDCMGCKYQRGEVTKQEFGIALIERQIDEIKSRGEEVPKELLFALEKAKAGEVDVQVERVPNNMTTEEFLQSKAFKEGRFKGKDGADYLMMGKGGDA